MSPAAPHRTRSRAQPAPGGLWLIVLALVTVQTLSLLHGIAHAGRAGQALAHAQVSAAESPVPSGSPATVSQLPSSWLDALFGGHGGHDCKAFDQASHADLVGAAAASLHFAALATAGAFVHIAWHVAAQARGFLARGPPVAA